MQRQGQAGMSMAGGWLGWAGGCVTFLSFPSHSVDCLLVGFGTSGMV